ncbi:MAG: response regulator [Enterobacteriaceae bacterium]
MKQPLSDKSILIVTADKLLRAQLAEYLRHQGGLITAVADSQAAIQQIEQQRFHCAICDISKSGKTETDFISQLHGLTPPLPVIIIAAAQEIAHIARAIRVGIEDVILKPFTDLSLFTEALLRILYPQPLSSEVMEQLIFTKEWQELRATPQKIKRLLKKLQPPLRQQMAHSVFTYRYLKTGEAGFVLDTGELSDHEMAFYCLDISHAQHDGLFAALLLRALFTHFMQTFQHAEKEQLQQITRKLYKANQTLQQASLTGPFPLLFGYYNSRTQELLLLSVGLKASLTIGEREYILSLGIPLGSLQGIYPCWLSQHAGKWQCKIGGNGSWLQLSLTTDC